MVADAKVLAVIPARGGSKSIPRKNIKLLDGQPLIAYSIAASREASLVDRLVVSTDDPQIARIAADLGAEVPFLRPADLAGDAVTDLPVFLHVLQTLEAGENYRPEVIVHLRPTSPLRPKGAVDEAVQLLLDSPAAESVRSVVPSGQNPYKMWRIKGGRLRPLLRTRLPEAYNAPRQSLPQTFWQTGQVDVVRRSTIIEKNSMTGDCILPLITDAAYAVDLDTLAQWAVAEQLIRMHSDAVVMPERGGLPAVQRIGLVVSDFEGVFTDNRVWLIQDGREMIACDRDDEPAVTRLQAAGIPFVILSTEANPVIRERAKKLNVRCYQRVSRKAEILAGIASERGIPLWEVAYIGSDVSDLEALRSVGLGVAVADARPEVLREAALILEQPGGRGAVRELCDLILVSRKRVVT